MKKILFSTYCKKTSHIDITLGIINMLSSSGYHVDVLSNLSLNIYNEIPLEKCRYNISSLCYDVIIVFNLKGYERIKKLIIHRIPVIYVLSSSDVENEYLIESNLFDRFLLINDSKNLYPQLFPSEYTTHIGYPFELIKNNVNISIQSNPNILVWVDFGILLKIIPVINRIYKYNVVVITDNHAKIKKIVNSNIEIVKSTDTNIVEYVNKSSLVISHGINILKCLQLSKPSIILGHYGFGRLITGHNFEQQYLSGFRGRLGGEREEYIHLNLLEFEINKSMDAIDTLCNDTKNLLKTINVRYSTTSSIISTLIKNVCKEKNNIWDTNYILGKSYIYIERKGRGYIVLDSRFKKIISEISYEGYNIIKSFEIIATPRSVYNLTGYEDKEEFIEFIQQLITNKILIVNE